MTTMIRVAAGLLWMLAPQAPLVGAPPTQPAATPPSTEVFLAPLRTVEGKLQVGRPENISNSPGYDNQPFFAPDGRTLFFTSARGSVSSKCGSPQTDIHKVDLQTRQVSKVTDTADCEYSPTVTPDGRHLSVIQVEPDGTQRLWRFTTQGASPSVLLADVKPVGYHAWLDPKTVALFVLGQPATLQVANLDTGKTDVIASDIGQSIQRIPGGGVSFVQQAGQGTDRTSTITKLTFENGKAVLAPLTPAVTPSGQTHVAWAPDGTLLTASNGSLYFWKEGAAGWQPVADLTALGLKTVSRLAVSPKGDRIAIVAAAGQ